MNESAILLRVARLEASNRRLRLALVLGGLSLMAALMLGAERAVPSITAESIKLVDSKGRLRAVLGQNDEGTFFFMNDQTGARRTVMAAQKEQAYIDMQDDQDKVRSTMAFTAEGPTFKLRDETGATVAALTTDKQGPLLNLREAGKSRVMTAVSDVVSDIRKE